MLTYYVRGYRIPRMLEDLKTPVSSPEFEHRHDTLPNTMLLLKPDVSLCGFYSYEIKKKICTTSPFKWPFFGSWLAAKSFSNPSPYKSLVNTFLTNATKKTFKGICKEAGESTQQHLLQRSKFMSPHPCCVTHGIWWCPLLNSLGTCTPMYTATSVHTWLKVNAFKGFHTDISLLGSDHAIW